MGLTFEFTPRYSDDGIKPVPLVHVSFINPKNGNSASVQCRIDSGADEIVLPAEVGIMLGIQLDKGEALELQGIAQDPVRGYRHNLEMQIEHDTHSPFTVPCIFAFGIKATGLLGLRGFFENYKVSFELYRNRFELTSIEEK
jgi:hypothetical protein